MRTQMQRLGLVRHPIHQIVGYGRGQDGAEYTKPLLRKLLETAAEWVENLGGEEPFFLVKRIRGSMRLVGVENWTCPEVTEETVRKAWEHAPEKDTPENSKYFLGTLVLHACGMTGLSMPLIKFVREEMIEIPKDEGLLLEGGAELRGIGQRDAREWNRAQRAVWNPHGLRAENMIFEPRAARQINFNAEAPAPQDDPRFALPDLVWDDED